MFDGIGEVASRVAELQSALDSYSHTRPASTADHSSASFQQTLNQAQAPARTAAPPVAGHTFSVGPNGASQMPATSPGSAAGALAALGLSGSGASGLGSLAGGTDPLAGLGGAGASGLSSLAGGADPLAGLSGSSASALGSLGGIGGAGFGALSGMGALGNTPGSQADSLRRLLAGGSAQPPQQGGIEGLVGQVAQSEGVNPALAQAVAKAESNFNPAAVSPAGAQGVMQVMPGTFEQYAGASAVPGGMPVNGSISQGFGPTDFTNEPPLDWNGRHYTHFHTGVDLAAPQGTPIRATMGGTVEVRSDPGGFGNLMVIRGGPWDVLYGHTSGHPASIQTGSVVKPGDVIGYVGSSGNSTGPHVHYEIRHSGRIVDPGAFLGRGTSSASPLSPVDNVKAGVGYLKDMLTRFKNNVPAALAAYNAGPAAVDKYGGVPPYPETQNYVKKTMQYARDLGA